MNLPEILVGGAVAWGVAKLLDKGVAKAAPAAKPAAKSKPQVDAQGRDKHGRPFVFIAPDRGGDAGRKAAASFDAAVAQGGPLPSGQALTAKRKFLKGNTVELLKLNDAFWLNHVDSHSPNQRVAAPETMADYAEYLRRAYAAAPR
ncbi:MAG TPA: hypothetical protein VFZ38_19450 [Vicinamibacterales bacterium]